MPATSMRRILASSRNWVSLCSGDGLRRAKAQKQARILMYHGIQDAEVSAELFDWQLGVLRNEFEPVSLKELLRRRTARALTGREVAITFDDGVRNHVTTAYPILRNRNVPATFFVCPALIDSGDWIWNTELRVRLPHLAPAERTALKAKIGSAADDIESLVSQTKRLDLASRRLAEKWVRDRTPAFSPTEQQLDRYAPMSWGQLGSLDPSLITIGSHTLNHPILPTLSADQLKEEIGASRRALQRRLGREVEMFCYPNGDNDVRAQSMVREHYAAAVSTAPRALADGDDLWLLPRIPAGETRGLFMRRLHTPAS